MSEHFEDSMGQQELPCDKCGKFCYLQDDATCTEFLGREITCPKCGRLCQSHKEVDGCCCYLLTEVLRLREGIKAYLNLDIETHQLKELIE